MLLAPNPAPSPVRRRGPVARAGVGSELPGGAVAAPEETGPDVAIGHADRLTQVSIDCNSFLDIPIAVRLVCRQ